MNRKAPITYADIYFLGERCWKEGGGIDITVHSDTNVRIKCRNCGTLNDENATFCDNCGSPL